jgi:hypothetical protein
MSDADRITFDGFIPPHKTAFMPHADGSGGHVRFDWDEDSMADALRLVLVFGQRVRVTVEPIDTPDGTLDAPAAAEPEAPRVKRWNDKS